MKFKWQVDSPSRMHLRTFLSSKRISRSLLKSIKFNGGHILVNDSPKRTNEMVEKGDMVQIDLPPEPSNPHVVLSDNPIDIRYEDEDYLIVNKPPYLPTVQSARNQVDTLVNRVKNYYVKQNYESQVIHVVTRLDQDTSGLVLLAKHRFAHSVIDQEMKQHRINKQYIALVQGKFDSSHGKIKFDIARDPNSFIKRRVVPSGEGKPSLTEYWVLDYRDGVSKVRVKLHTGRTHQIRVHMSAIGHPLIGDALYGYASPAINRQALHCYLLDFQNVFRDKLVKVETKLPEDMSNYLERRRG